MRREQSPDPQVRVGARPFRDERVSSFLDAVVHESVGAIQALDQLQADRLPQVRVDLFLWRPAHESERGQVGAVAEAGELLQPLSRRRRETGQLADHEVYHVIRVPFGANAIDIPRPACTDMIESKQAFFSEGGDELDREKRIPRRLVVNHLHQ